MPIVGLGAVADSVVRLAFLVFTRKQNLPEWNRMLASLCRNHFVVIGVGKVGYQVIKQLLELRETVVAIEMASGSPLLGELFDKGVPVIQGNARQSSVLEQAGVRQARAVIITTSDDLTNLDAAITARELNANAKIVIRLFDETLATKVAGRLLDADNLDISGGRARVHRRGDRPEDLPGFSTRRPVRPCHRHDDLPDRTSGRRSVGEIQIRQANQYRHAAGPERRKRKSRARDRVGTRRYDSRHRAGRRTLTLESMNQPHASPEPKATKSVTA